MSRERLEEEVEHLRNLNNKLRNEIISQESKKRVNDDYIKMLEEMVQTFKNQRNYEMQNVERLERQNKRYQEGLIELEDWAIGLVDIIGKDYAFHISSTIGDLLEELEGEA